MTGCGRKIGPYDCCTVVCGDCLELMKAIPDGAVDAVITDPPYKFEPIGGGICGRRDYQKQLDSLGLCDFEPEEFLSILPNEVPCAIFCNRPLLPVYLKWATKSKMKWDIHSGYKKNPIPAFNSHFLSDVEHVFVAWQSGGTWNNNAGMDSYRRAFPWGETTSRHPAEKPESAIERYILVFSNKNETILDPFLGSGTTAVAAKKLGRHFLGFEISPEYCRIAEERIALVERQPNLFKEKAEQATLEMFKK